MALVRRQEASYNQRYRIQALRFEAGWTYERIEENQGLRTTTFHDICHAPTAPKKRKGRPFSIDPAARRLLIGTATRYAEHRRMRYVDIADIFGITGSEKTLRKAFVMEGYHRRKAQRKPHLTDAQKAKRLQFALDHRGWSCEDWQRVIWTDECYIWLSGTRGNIWVTRCSGEKYEEACISPKFKKQNALMILEAILGGTKSPLVLWKREDWGTITALSYCTHVLTQVLWPFWYWESQWAGRQLWLMEDGAPADRAWYTVSGKCRRVVQGGPERSWSTKGGCGPRGPLGPLQSILIHTFLKFYQKCGPGWIRVDQEDQEDHNPPWWTRSGLYILLMLRQDRKSMQCQSSTGVTNGD